MCRAHSRRRIGHLLDELGRLGAVVEAHPAVGDVRDRGDLGVGVGGELVGEDDVGGQDELHAAGLGLGFERLSQLELVLLDKRAVVLSRQLQRQRAAAQDTNLPTLRPRALRKVKTMPPPMTSLSTLASRDSITPILEETCTPRRAVPLANSFCLCGCYDLRTLEPPTMAAKGRFGSLTAPSR